MRARPQFGHRAQMPLFSGSKSVEANAEEAFIQSGDRSFRRGAHIGQFDRRRRCRIPGMLAPLLQEVGISLCLFDNLLDGSSVERNSQIPRRLGNCDARSRRQQWTNLRKVEESLSVGL